MDAALAAFRHSGADVPRYPLAADARTAGRTFPDFHARERRIPVVCHQPGRAPHRRICALRRAQAQGWRVVPESAGHGGDGASHRHAAHALHGGDDATHPAARLCRFLLEDRHQHQRFLRQVLHCRMDCHRPVWHRGCGVSVVAGQEDESGRKRQARGAE